MRDSSECIVLSDAQKLVMPARSKLYRFAPIAAGSANRESLSSYFCRLAHAHCLTPHYLAEAIVLPLIGIKHSDTESGASKSWQLSFFNGIGTVPQVWSTALQKLTTVPNLHELTLLSLKEVVKSPGLISKEKRWCPMCLLEAKEAGAAYGKLIWEIEAVTACPIHEIKLINHCSCLSDVAPPLSRVKFLPNICRKCGEELAIIDKQIVRASKEETLRAQLVMRFLDSELFNAGIKTNKFPQFLSSAVDKVAKGKMAWLAKILGVSKSVVHGWMNDGHVPSFVRIVSIAEKLGCEIAEVFEGDTSKLKPMLNPSLDVSIKSPKKKIDRIEIGRKLEAVLAQDEQIFAAAIAKSLNVSKRYLYRKFGDLIKQLSARRQQFLAEQTKAGRKSREDLFRTEVRQMLEEGVSATRRNLVARLGPSGWIIRKTDKEMCNRVFAEEKALRR